MKKINLQNSNFVVESESTVREVMERITDNQRGTVIVVDEEFYLQGIITDGDIRRGMLRGATTIAPVSKIMNINPVTMSSNGYSQEKSDEFFKENMSINVVPIVNVNNKLVNVAVRSSHIRKA